MASAKLRAPFEGLKNDEIINSKSQPKIVRPIEINNPIARSATENQKDI